MCTHLTTYLVIKEGDDMREDGVVAPRRAEERGQTSERLHLHQGPADEVAVVRKEGHEAVAKLTSRVLEHAVQLTVCQRLLDQVQSQSDVGHGGFLQGAKKCFSVYSN